MSLGSQNYYKYIAGAILFLLASAVVAGLAINYQVKHVAEKYIYDPTAVPQADAVLVLGAYVWPDGTLSDMLQDRVTVGYDLYQQGKVEKILVSGDHGRQDYDEVNSMKSYLKAQGVPGQDVFMDHAGFSTYESIYRARDIFQVQKIIIVTQGYHLSRAVYIARILGLESYGVASDLHDYGPAMAGYKTRELIARNKDFWLTIFKPQPTFLGEAIPVLGDGTATDDK